ncbi:nucleoside phosphatase family-domain-containing protein [Armillaria borealis]|uniref:guanosine-diphosphatase n=1 Tax=Armillaria borealis TaxID=47425 RepID=A0AA39JSY7_9AGAR|nr:nucleoside phosphatase family-domain-containing protein [Armillaria borealis]
MLSPRSSNYDRIEGGMGPSRGYPAKQKFAWKKFAVGAAVIIGLVWIFGPRERRHMPSWVSDSTAELEESHTTTPWSPSKPVTTSPPTLPAAPNNPSKQPPLSPPVNDDDKPVTLDTDPNPAGTTYCDSPYSSTVPLIQYALMVDAGSTGSRIHIYKFNHCSASGPTYEYEVFKMTQPGLSYFPDDPEAAAKSLDVLMAEAVRTVPVSLQKCAPVAVKATAGLRLLGPEKSAAILDKVKEHLSTSYPFPLVEQGGVEVMDGSEEGVYAWITANYLLGTLSSASSTSSPIVPYAVLDLGGASTQIVFEPRGKSHVLYQHSYLGYGLMRARRHVHQLVEFMSTIRPATIANPCLARGTTKDVEIDGRGLTMYGEEIGSYEACNRIVELVLAKDAVCELKPCSFNGGGRVLLLSYFYDRVSPLLAPGVESLTVGGIADLAKTVCQGRQAWLLHPHWGTNPELMEELEGRPEWCLDLTFMNGLLRLGYEFGNERDVSIGKKIAGTELGWCLGATLAMIGGELKCRV